MWVLWPNLFIALLAILYYIFLPYNINKGCVAQATHPL